MKAITLWQPWASLIVEGVKTIETRPKRSPWSSAIGETIAVHASRRLPCGRNTVLNVGGWDIYDDGATQGHHDESWRLLNGARLARAPFGAVLGTCKLVDVVPIVDSWAATDCVTLVRKTNGEPDDLAWRAGEDIRFVSDQQPYGSFADGRFALLLDEVVKFDEPIPARGYQGLWNWDGAT